MATRRSSKKSSSGGIGCLVWLALLLAICLLFFLNRGKIEKTLQNTGFLKLLRSGSPVPERSAPPPALSPRPRATEAPPRRSAAPEASQEPRPAASAAPERTPRPAESQRPTESPKPRMRAASLCFVRIEEDGSIIRQEVKRSIPVSDSPLLDSLTALMKGPTADELNRGFVSLVPQGSKILSVTMRGSTALVNFNEAFMFNTLGIEGYAGQLKQVVWTATAFGTVHDVQILIEGKLVDYMGGEGVFIGRPLSRNSF